MRNLRPLVKLALFSLVFLQTLNLLEAEKIYTVKFTNTYHLPKWAGWIIKDTTYTIEWEGSGGPYCSGSPAGCFGLTTITITSHVISKTSNNDPITPDMYPPDSLLIVGDDYLIGVDSGSRVAFIRMADGSQGQNGDYFDISQRTIFPMDSTQVPDAKDFRRNIANPVLFPTQRARYSPDANAFVAYFYDVVGD